MLTFAAFGEDLARDLDAAYDACGVDDELLAHEVMVGCTQGMLLCLDREHRVAYILGDVLELTSRPPIESRPAPSRLCRSRPPVPRQPAARHGEVG